MKVQYVLRTVAADGESRGGFKWPKRGKAEFEKGVAVYTGDRQTATDRIIEYWANGRPRKLIGYIGEDGRKEDTPYRIEDGKFVEVEK